MGLPRTLRTQGRTLPGIWQLSSWRSGDGIPSVCISFRILSSLADNQHRFLFLLLYVFSLLHIHNRILFIFFRCSKHKYIRPRSVVSCRFRDTKCSALSTHIHYCTLWQITNLCSKNLSLVKYCWLIDLNFRAKILKSKYTDQIQFLDKNCPLTHCALQSECIMCSLSSLDFH